MDIIQLLETLKPAAHVISVEVQSNKNFWDSIIAVWPSLLTGGVAFAGIWASHRQFKITGARQAQQVEEAAQRQTAQFKIDVDRQIKELRLTTRLATDIELKKENYREVRTACIKFLSESNTINCLKYQLDVAKTLAIVQPENEVRTDAFLSSTASHQMSQTNLAGCQFSLLSYLNEKDDATFIKSISSVFEETVINDSTPEVFGAAIVKCNIELRSYILKKQNEIVALSDSIDN
ncbi:hypothetical protein [Buttiauxella brennerae]|uniref:hypothetical protein n=1 Tax=Buttiauxella brennerae TaxID=82988 RepID=UPI00286EF08B|nr:hypothetical protein [Buttiauxella brennerae]